MNWIIVVILLIIIVLIVRIKIRGCFWIDKKGNRLSMREFWKRFNEGVTGITPLQQTKTTLWSYPLVLGGIITGLVIMILRRQWWLVLILSGSLPMTLMGLLSIWQKYKIQKKVSDTMKELENKK